MNFKKLFKTLTGEEPQTEKEPVHQHNYFNDLPRPLTDIEKETYYRMSVQRTDADLTVHSEKGVAMDSAEDNNAASQGVYNNMVGAIPDIIYSHFAAQGFIGYNACAILKQNWMISNACTVPAEDAIQSGYTLCNKDDSETISEEELENFKAVSYSKYHIDDICRRIEINKKVFGIGLAVPCMDDDYDYENPFNIDGVKPNSYKGWTVVDPYWFAPELDEDAATNPASKNFYQPTWYRMPNGRRVHRSHCIVLTNSVIPDILKPTYFYGGIPLTQMIFQRVYAAEKVANEAPLLALTKRLLVVDANLENFVANQRDAEETLKTISWLRDNFGVAIKRPGDQIQQIDTGLTDFDSLIMTQYQLVASIAQMPATKLLKTTPKGFNATGEFELKDYIQTLQAIQENDMKPLIERHNLLLAKSRYNKKMEITVKFNPIDMPTEADKASINQATASTLSTLTQAGIISAEEAREHLKKDETAGFPTIDVESTPEDENQIAETMQALMAAGNQQKQEPTEEEEIQKKNDIATDAAEFKESEHPRDEDGKFTDKGSGGGKVNPLFVRTKTGYTGNPNLKSNLNRQETKKSNSFKHKVTSQQVEEHMMSGNGANLFINDKKLKQFNDVARPNEIRNLEDELKRFFHRYREDRSIYSGSNGQKYLDELYERSSNYIDSIVDKALNTDNSSMKLDFSAKNISDKHPDATTPIYKTNSGFAFIDENDFNKYSEAQLKNRKAQNKYFRDLKEKAKEIPENLKKSIEDYTGAGYFEINQALRGKKNIHSNMQWDENTRNQKIKDLKSIMTPAENDMLLHRGTTGKEFQTLIPQKLINQFKEGDYSVCKQLAEKIQGKTFVSDGFLSMTDKINGFNDKSSPYDSETVQWSFKVPKGTKSFDVRALTKHTEEDEILLDAGSKIKIEKVNFGLNKDDDRQIFIVASILQQHSTEDTAINFDSTLDEVDELEVQEKPKHYYDDFELRAE